MNKFTLRLLCLSLMVTTACAGQVDCKTIDLNKAPGKWIWNKGRYANQWQFSDPIRKELQRIMPVALDGLYATNSIAYGDLPTIPNTQAAPKQYDCYLMLKKYSCVMGNNILKPEGETGCWVYFNVNTMFDGGQSSESGVEFPYYVNEGTLLVGDYFIERDAAGNKILYANTPYGNNQFRGYFFSGKEKLPIRRISWRDFITSYKVSVEKKLRSKLYSARESLENSEKNVTTTKYEDTKQYLTNLIADKKKEIITLESDINALLSWFNQILTHKKINEMARALKPNPDKQDFYDLLNQTDTTNTFPVWVEDIGFYDLSKSKDQPQCILFTLIRQDDDLPKKNFMDLLASQFNMDVLCKMVGEAPKVPNGINSLVASINTAKTETKSNQLNTSAFVYSFDNSPEQQFPKGWEGEKTIKVKKFENKNWLTIAEKGFWYPKQFNKEIKDNFTLSFDLGWEKDISYYSGLFTVAISEMEYDNPTQRYRTEDEPAKYWSFYDNYAGNFRRIMLWFDPYWNNGGMLDIYSYERNESVVKEKRVMLPKFYMSKNTHQIKLVRKGNNLQVYINDKLEAEVNNVFIPAARYNLYTFSRYIANNSNQDTDIFYIKNIKANYE
ncbi:MAG: hypothetical protein ACK57D_07815 [Sphingobacteriales bacterium]|jgi:hypothetical protein